MVQEYFDDHQTKAESWAQDKLNEFGWYVHFVPEDSDFPNATNYHTHGLTDNFNHLDLQICFPLSTEIAHSIFTEVVDLIKKGARFEPGKKYAGILAGDFGIEFIEAMECNRKLLRIIFPNRSGSYEGKLFSDQFNQTYI